MFQVYVLLILTNLVGGTALASGFLQEKLPQFADLAKLLSGQVFRAVLGLATFVTGFFGLLTVLPGDLPLLGDLLPALSALLVGTGLVLEFYHARNPDTTPDQKHIDDIILKNKSIFGLVGMAAGLVHFIFPTVLLV